MSTETPTKIVAVTVSEAARTLNVTTQSVYRWLRDGTLAAYDEVAGVTLATSESVDRLKAERYAQSAGDQNDSPGL